MSQFHLHKMKLECDSDHKISSNKSTIAAMLGNGKSKARFSIKGSNNSQVCQATLTQVISRYYNITIEVNNCPHHIINVAKINSLL